MAPQPQPRAAPFEVLYLGYCYEFCHAKASFSTILVDHVVPTTTRTAATAATAETTTSTTFFPLVLRDAVGPKCTHAYLTSRSGATKLLDIGTPYTAALDLMWARHLKSQMAASTTTTTATTTTTTTTTTAVGTTTAALRAKITVPPLLSQDEASPSLTRLAMSSNHNRRGATEGNVARPMAKPAFCSWEGCDCFGDQRLGALEDGRFESKKEEWAKRRRREKEKEDEHRGG